jgi:hypothetical protein
MVLRLEKEPPQQTGCPCNDECRRLCLLWRQGCENHRNQWRFVSYLFFWPEHMKDAFVAKEVAQEPLRIARAELAAAHEKVRELERKYYSTMSETGADGLNNVVVVPLSFWWSPKYPTTMYVPQIMLVQHQKKVMQEELLFRFDRECDSRGQRVLRRLRRLRGGR